MGLAQCPARPLAPVRKPNLLAASPLPTWLETRLFTWCPPPFLMRVLLIASVRSRSSRSFNLSAAAVREPARAGPLQTRRLSPPAANQVGPNHREARANLLARASV